MPADSPDESTADRYEALDPDDGTSKARFMVSLGRPQLAALRDFAAGKGLSVAEVVRRAVDEFLDRRQDGTPPPAGG